MAEIPSHQPLSPPSTDPPSQYWCYHCDKRVSVETLTDLPDIICFECKNGFVEVISVSVPPPPQPSFPSSNRNQEHSFSNQFLQILRLIAEAARDDDNPPPPPPPHPASSDPGDFLRIELNGWNNNEVNDDENENEDEDEDDIDVVNNNNNEDVEIAANQDEEEEDVRRRRRDLLRLRIRDFATRATSNRNRILDWSEILMGLDDHTMEFRVEMPEWDGYVGNPEDYVDAAGYEALLQNLAESDGGGRAGAPPASKAAVEALKAEKITEEEGCLACAICKDVVGVGEMGKKLPCGHGYHGDCIVTWLGTRNTCPICRYELPTEDADYEEQRRQKRSSSTGPSSTSSAHAGAGV